jgi:hypothetical protein
MILVTGDVVLDHNIYAGARLAPSADGSPATQYRTEPGGAMLTYGLLQALDQSAREAAEKRDAAAKSNLTFGLKDMAAADLATWPPAFHAGGIWEPFPVPGADKNARQWRLSKNLGYGAKGYKDYPASADPGSASTGPRVVVIDDGGLGFRLRTAEKCWPKCANSADGATGLEWVVLKMSHPLGSGDLFRELANRHKEKLIVIISGDDLRREDVRLRRGLSWESTVDDLVDAVRSNPGLSGLRSCSHLVITLRGDAALWLDNPGGDKPGPCHLVFDRERGEGEWEDAHMDGRAFGYLSAVTAAIAWHLYHAKAGDELDLIPALHSGLSTARFLREHGHGPTGDDIPGFPFRRAAGHILAPKTKYGNSSVPGPAAECDSLDKSQCDENWTLLRRISHADTFPGPLFGPARRLALLGPAFLENAPCARFGKLLTMDRREIEALRSLRHLMLRYHKGGPQKQPLSLAVFGAPGSGKSFGLKQIAEGVFGEKNPVLEFNLSQFSEPADLIGAYHQVRDHVLAGFTPVVFWDEFDSSDYKWLQYLLAPMQDGKFQAGQLTHTIGKCVFVFAGGTSRDYEHFGWSAPAAPNETEAQTKARLRFVMAKGPDFKSRLAGFLNVLGPNPRQNFDPAAAGAGLDPWVDDPQDTEYPVRRALLLRSMLGMTKDKENSPLAIDRGLLTALIENSHYLHGARSLEKLVTQMADAGGFPLRRAQLPPDELLALYVEHVSGFHALIRRTYAFEAQAEKLGEFLHEDWRANLTEAEIAKKYPYNVPWKDLEHDGRVANYAAAMRIPEILALAGFVLEPGEATAEENAKVQDFLKQHLELLSEAEHKGWEEQRRTEGWTFGKPRDNKLRLHDLLLPYLELPPGERAKDRRTIENYPKYASQAGFKIVPARKPS